jgi:hypothetical protein
MRLSSTALVMLTAFAASCGSEPAGQIDLSFSAPSQLPLTNCPAGARSRIGASLQAVLAIGGHDPCQLVVDPSTLAVSGVCDPITVGIVRPLGLSYWLPVGSTSDLAALAYIISWVDLRKETLGDTTAEVTVDLTPNGVVAKLLSTDLDVQNLRAGTACTAITDDATLQMCKAEAWAKELFKTEPILFDIDTPLDGVPNIVEACNGTLFP